MHYSVIPEIEVYDEAGHKESVMMDHKYSMFETTAFRRRSTLSPYNHGKHSIKQCVRKMRGQNESTNFKKQTISRRCGPRGRGVRRPSQQGVPSRELAQPNGHNAVQT